jgi:two-component system sensor histidine kinase VicK
MDFRKRGIRHRIITEITSENLSYCKNLMEFVDELRHLDQIKGNFSVSERDYQATAVIQEAQPITQSMYTTVRSFIEQQQYVFDTLWHKALPARQRIKQIEEHTKREFIDTLQEGIEIDNLAHKFVKSAKEEMLVMFPTVNTFYRYRIERLVESMEQGAASGVKTRILIYADNQKEAEKVKQNYNQSKNITIHLLKKPKLQSKVTCFVIDSEICLAIELKDDNSSDSVDASGFATYSNSESTVATYISIFETLWMQSELQGRK